MGYVRASSRAKAYFRGNGGRIANLTKKGRRAMNRVTASPYKDVTVATAKQRAGRSFGSKIRKLQRRKLRSIPSFDSRYK